MFDFLKKNRSKRYKLKNLYVAKTYKITDKTYELHTSANIYYLSESYYSTKIVSYNFWHTCFINPITREKYKVKPIKVGDIYCPKKHLKHINDYIRNIPDEIFLRGDYLTLEEILNYSKELELN